jgi:hypothetical protein
MAMMPWPSYLPAKNPYEYWNCDLKQGISAKPAPKNAAKLEENINLLMQMLKENSERLRKYFNHIDIKYAA